MLPHGDPHSIEVDEESAAVLAQIAQKEGLLEVPELRRVIRSSTDFAQFIQDFGLEADADATAILRELELNQFKAPTPGMEPETSAILSEPAVPRRDGVRRPTASFSTNSLRFKSLRLYVRVWHYVLPLIAFTLAAWLRIGTMNLRNHPADFDPKMYLGVLTFTTIVWVIAVENQGLSDIYELFRDNTGIRKSVTACLITFIALLIMLFFRQQSFSRVFFVASAIALLTLTLSSRALLRRLLDVSRSIRNSVPVLMIGTGDYASRVATQLASVPIVTSKVVGYVRIGAEQVQVDDAPIFDPEDVEFGRVPPFEEIVVAAAPQQLPEMRGLLTHIGQLGIPVRAVLDLGKSPVVPERLFQLGDLQMFELAYTPLESATYLFIKRAFDVAFSVFVLLMLAPFIAMVALTIKLTSPGPVLFRQERIGLNGKVFTMYKFRTMRVSTRSKSDTLWSASFDDRRTPFGTFLRRYSLDELPQFLNVLKGDMSVVGPRPEQPNLVYRFLDETAHYAGRRRLKVGITGWAQVNGWRGDAAIPTRSEFDLFYLQNWSISLDMRIILLTARSLGRTLLSSQA
jgi:Undecaprenyl-phosphate glucose phosphotransferase